MKWQDRQMERVLARRERRRARWRFWAGARQKLAEWGRELQRDAIREALGIK